MSQDYDIAIIGAGPGGYVAAIKAAQLGAKVALVEKEDIGGICLNWGCIPTKVILASVDKYNEAQKLSKFGISVENLSIDYKKVFDRKTLIVEKLRKSLAQLIKSYKINIFKGEAVITSANSLTIGDEKLAQDINFKNLILATGSKPASLPGLEIDHEFILDTNDVLSLKQLPNSVMIVGSGASGIEWTRIFESFGTKVILVEIAPRLAPMFDESISEKIERLFKRKKIEFYTNTKIEKIENKTITLDIGKDFTPDAIFLATGRTPNLEIEGLKKLNISTKGKFIEVNNNLQTNVDNIYAIGDITGILQLAHVASHQGVAAVEHILLNKDSHIDYNAVPKIIYGNPEIASVGYTEEELVKLNIQYEKSNFPIGAVGKSLIDDEIEGFIKVLASKDKIYGVHIIAAHADLLIQQPTIALNSNLSPYSIKETVFAHPTISEAVHEAFLGIDGLSLHTPKLK